MVEARSREAVLRRIEEMIGLENEIVSMLEHQRFHLPEPVQAAAIEHLRGTAAARRDALRARLSAAGGVEAGSEGTGGESIAHSTWADDASHPRSGSVMLTETVSEFAKAVAAYSILYTTARLMFDGETCDLAEEHMHGYAREMQAVSWLIPDVVAGELRQGDLTCRCICPACSIGACLCVRNSINTLLDGWGASQPFDASVAKPEGVDALLEGWGAAGLPYRPGVDLRSPPRPGSQLAEAGIRQGDRILSVDDQEVSTNDDLQTALRRHQIGEEVRLRVERRAGEIVEIVARHVSDPWR